METEKSAFEFNKNLLNELEMPISDVGKNYLAIAKTMSERGCEFDNIADNLGKEVSQTYNELSQHINELAKMYNNEIMVSEQDRIILNKSISLSFEKVIEQLKEITNHLVGNLNHVGVYIKNAEIMLDTFNQKNPNL
jgi:hypothetical protein